MSLPVWEDSALLRSCLLGKMVFLPFNSKQNMWASVGWIRLGDKISWDIETLIHFGLASLPQCRRNQELAVDFQLPLEHQDEQEKNVRLPEEQCNQEKGDWPWVVPETKCAVSHFIPCAKPRGRDGKRSQILKTQRSWNSSSHFTDEKIEARETEREKDRDCIKDSTELKLKPVLLRLTAAPPMIVQGWETSNQATRVGEDSDQFPPYCFFSAGEGQGRVRRM